MLKSVKRVQNEKSPGTDGLQAEFYKHFWEDLHTDMLQCFDYAYDSGKLSISQRRGIITLIPKPNKDTTVLDNLRSISLLNADYKILMKVIAKRLEKVLPRIINPDQTGYIKNRYIGENVRLISDIMNYTEENNIPGIALFIDFRKAFDTLKGTLLTTALKTSISGRTSKPGLKFYTTMFPAAFLTMDLDRNSFQENEVFDKVGRCPDYCL